jgi:hypothetical protein
MYLRPATPGRELRGPRSDGRAADDRGVIPHESKSLNTEDETVDHLGRDALRVVPCWLVRLERRPLRCGRGDSRGQFAELGGFRDGKMLLVARRNARTLFAAATEPKRRACGNRRCADVANRDEWTSAGRGAGAALLNMNKDA